MNQNLALIDHFQLRFLGLLFAPIFKGQAAGMLLQLGTVPALYLINTMRAYLLSSIV